MGAKTNNYTDSIAEDFYDYEADNWQLLNDNLDILSKAIENEKKLLSIDEGPWEVYARLVEYRKGSLSAKIDNKSLSQRPCFLCEENRPEEQGILDWEEYEILANPYPLDDYHFTIAAREHVPQRIKGRIKDMAKLTRVMPDNCVFYNGPLCGASAPDHFHFQGIKQVLSINMWRPLSELKEIAKIGKSKVYRSVPEKSLYPYIIIDSAADKDLVLIFDKLYDSLPEAEPEPMMNIVMYKDGGRVRTLIVPRKRHRPSFYGIGEGEMLISPASIEMLGTFVTSRKEDFDRLDLDTVKRIYQEVTLSEEELDEVINRFMNQQ